MFEKTKLRIALWFLDGIMAGDTIRRRLAIKVLLRKIDAFLKEDKNMETIGKVLKFASGYRTQIACVGGILTALAATIAKAAPLIADGVQYSDITSIAATPEWALLLVSVQQLYQRLATKKVEAKLDKQGEVK